MVYGFRRKLFGTLFLVNLILVCVMSLVLYWSFRYQAENNLQQIEVGALETITEALVLFYEVDDSWNFIREDELKWGVFLQSLRGGAFYQLPADQLKEVLDEEFQLRDAHPRPLHRTRAEAGGKRDSFPPSFQQGGGFDVPYRPKPDASSTAGRLRLVDTEGVILGGMWDYERKDSDQPLSLPLMSGSETIGFLELYPQAWLEDGLNEHFRKKVLQTLFFSGAIAFIFSWMVALPLGNLILLSVKKIVSGVRHLAEGNLSWRIEDGGEDEFGDLINNVNNLALQLEETDQLRRSMMADVSHELRTPIAVLQAEVEAIQDGIRPCTPDQMESLHKNITNLSKLVDDLFTLSLADSGALTCQRQPCDVITMMERTFSTYESLFRKKKIRFSYDIPGEARVLADTVRLNQVFSNLLNNSFYYTDDGGISEVKAEVRKDSLVIEFQDSAPGVPEENLEKLFERFFREDKSRSRSLGGAGLGLPLSKTIVEMHEGTIQVEPSQLGGIRMTITLPLLKTQKQK